MAYGARHGPESVAYGARHGPEDLRAIDGFEPRNGLERAQVFGAVPGTVRHTSGAVPGTVRHWHRTPHFGGVP